MCISSLEAGGTSFLGVFFLTPNSLEGPSNIRQRVPVRGSAGWLGSVKGAGRYRAVQLFVCMAASCLPNTQHSCDRQCFAIQNCWPMTKIRGNGGTSLPHTSEKPNAATSNVTLACPVGTRRHGQFAQRFDSMTPDCLHSVCACLRIIASRRLETANL